MPLVALRVLLAQPGSRRQVPLLVVLLGRERLRDGQLVLERLQDQRAGRERLGVEEHVADRGRRRGEHPVGRPQTLLLQRGHHESLGGGKAQPDSAHRADPQDGASSEPPFGLVSPLRPRLFLACLSSYLSPGFLSRGHRSRPCLDRNTREPTLRKSWRSDTGLNHRCAIKNGELPQCRTGLVGTLDPVCGPHPNAHATSHALLRVFCLADPDAAEYLTAFARPLVYTLVGGGALWCACWSYPPGWGRRVGARPLFPPGVVLRWVLLCGCSPTFFSCSCPATVLPRPRARVALLPCLFVCRRVPLPGPRASALLICLTRSRCPVPASCRSPHRARSGMGRPGGRARHPEVQAARAHVPCNGPVPAPRAWGGRDAGRVSSVSDPG